MREYPNASPPQSAGNVWNSYANASQREAGSNPANLSFNAPAHRKIEAGDASGDTYEALGTPISWTNTETGEKKVLTLKPVDDSTGGTSHPLAISTADNFILIAEKFGGEMNTG